MVTHIVLMKFKPDNKAQHLAQARTMLLAMQGVVEPLRSIEVGLNQVPGERAFDLSLLTRFDDFAGLDAYAVHPVHVRVKDFLRGVLEASHVVDYDNSSADTV